VKLSNDGKRRKLIKAKGRKFSVEKEVDKSLEQKFIGRNSSDISDVVIDLILCKKSLEQEYINLKEVIDHARRLRCLEVGIATEVLIILVAEGGKRYSSCNEPSTDGAHGTVVILTVK
jgi:predicted ATPase